MKLLVDTSVWADHLRSGDPFLAMELEQGAVLVHPWVVGELACSQLRARVQILRLLADLPQASVATTNEVLHLLDSRQLIDRGIGYLDAQLLASCLLESARLWTRDQELRTVAAELELLAPQP